MQVDVWPLACRASRAPGVATNEQRRICFHWSDGDAYEVEIVDYH
jgi:plasmid maintenance system killer protein